MLTLPFLQTGSTSNQLVDSGCHFICSVLLDSFRISQHTSFWFIILPPITIFVCLLHKNQLQQQSPLWLKLGNSSNMFRYSAFASSEVDDATSLLIILFPWLPIPFGTAKLSWTPYQKGASYEIPGSNDFQGSQKYSTNLVKKLWGIYPTLNLRMETFVNIGRTVLTSFSGSLVQI